MSWKQEAIWQDLHEGSCTGEHEVNSRIFHHDSKNEGLDIVYGLAPSEKEKETAYRVRARDVGAPATLGSIASNDWKIG
jgi:hypothetical protein